VGREGQDGQDVQDLDRLSAKVAIFIINVSPGHGVPMYLTPEHMDR